MLKTSVAFLTCIDTNNTVSKRCDLKIIVCALPLECWFCFLHPAWKPLVRRFTDARDYLEHLKGQRG